MVTQSAHEAPTMPKSKPSGGIRIVHKVAKPNGAHSVDAPDSAAPAAQPHTPPKRSAEEVWAEILSEGEGDMVSAANILIDRILAGSKDAGRAVGALIEYDGAGALTRLNILNALRTAMEGNDGDVRRPAALAACAALAQTGGKPAEPFLLDVLPLVLVCCADKKEKTRAAALAVGESIVDVLNTHATRALIEILFQSMGSGIKWQARVASLRLLGARAKRCPAETGHCLLHIMPVLSGAVVDTRSEVAEAASNALLSCCYTAGNRDFEKHIPAIVSCTARPSEVADTVTKLSATTFVQSMEDASLAVLAPLMHRALHERSAKTQRRASVIINNFSKLVTDPADARPFLPVLIPDLSKVAEEAADPELREIAAQARDALQRIKDADEATMEAAGGPAAQYDAVERALDRLAKAAAPSVDFTAPGARIVLAYVASLGASLIASHARGPRTWEACTRPFLAELLGSEETAALTSSALRSWALTHMGDASGAAEEAAYDDELCNCEFSLAYGGRILLRNTNLRLRRGRRYGLCGANGVGKSTLMRAIANGQLEGFPPKEELRTVYVEHDIDASDSDIPVVDFIFQDKNVQEAVQPTKDDVVAALSAVGFGSGLQARPVGSLSGGWKMKLALARAMLMKADILLLDEPTNHLDTTNVAWLVQYLTTMSDVSSMIVSHDSGFLDNVCTDIIHYESRKLKLYPGNLSEFVKVKPEAKAYYELNAASFAFKFPDPGFLDGIKGKTQSVMRMTNVTFGYPGSKRKQLEGVSCRCTLGSRVAVLGSNGAGKSTLIKLLTGEMVPDEGTVWKHPNLRVAYVAQHAFHHIEQHLDETPSSYIWWRFGEGEDREAKLKVTMRVTEAEKAEREARIARGERVVDYLNSRRMGKNKEFEYEIVWVGQGNDQNTWVDRSELMSEKWGLSKMVEEIDSRIASYRLYRPLSKEVVLSHLKDFGLEEEISGHNAIRGLSGGQKVKLVLAAAMWNLPHVIVLDEPTNYLDRDSLGALATAIREFAGGVVIISHNNEFTSALCSEEWQIAGGKLTVVGGQKAMHTVPSQASMASIASVASVASLSTLGGGDSDSGLTGDGEVNGVEMTPEEEAAAAAALDASLAAKAARRADKERIAQEKAMKKAEKAKLRFSKKF